MPEHQWAALAVGAVFGLVIGTGIGMLYRPIYIRLMRSRDEERDD